jgi:hypothetical protein
MEPTNKSPEVEPESVQIQNERELREAEIALRREELQVRLKEAEVALRRCELEAQSKGKRTTSMASPLGIAIITGILGLLGAAAGNYWQNRTNLQLEQKKFESNLIVKAIETGDPAIALENLLFLTKTGLLPDSESRIQAYYASIQQGQGKGQGPVLPAASNTSSVDTSGNPEINTNLPEQGTGYTTNNRGDQGQFQFGLEQTIKAIQELGKDWSSKHAEIRISIGQISLKGGGIMPPHQDHRDGREFDIRPLRTDGQNMLVTVNDAEYSRDLTKELILLIKQKFPGAAISFGDQQLVDAGLTKGGQGFNNHIHVRLP